MPEQPLLRPGQQVVAPLDRAAQGPLARRSVAAAARQQRQSAVEAGEHALRRHELHARRRKLQSEREAVEPHAEVAQRSVRRERRVDRPRPRQEEPDGLGLGQGRNRVLLLGFDTKRLAARREQTQVRTASEELGEVAGRLHDLLDVVEQHEHAAIADMRGEVVRAPRVCAIAETTSAGSVNACSGDPPHAVRRALDLLGGGLQREPRLARPARAGQGQQAGSRRARAARDLGELALAAEERRRLHGQVGRVQAPERREVEVAELVQPLRRAQVLEPVLAQVA